MRKYLASLGALGLLIATLALGSAYAVENETVTGSVSVGSGITTSAAGGVVTLGAAVCTGSGATPQTCNGQRGIVTTNSLSTAGATAASYVINNSSVTASSLVHCESQGYSGTYVTNGYPVIMDCTPGSGTITVHIVNTHAANALAGTIAVGFTVMN